MTQVRDHLGHYVYPVHRLDRPVSGIVIFGKNPEPVKLIKENWHTDQVKKYYLALSRGNFKEPGQFDFDLSDFNKVKKEAITKYRPLELYKSATLHEVEILTGRHHQIRRHFSRRVDHLLGDRKYGKKKYNDYYLENFGLERIFLHSHRFEFFHPMAKEQINIFCPLFPDLQECLNKMKKEHLETIEKSEYIWNHDE